MFDEVCVFYSIFEMCSNLRILLFSRVLYIASCRDSINITNVYVYNLPRGNSVC